MLKSENISSPLSFNSLKLVYLILIIAGTIVPWFWLEQDLAALSSPTLFLQRAFANYITAGLTGDLLISAVAFFCFVWIEFKRLSIAPSWIIMYVGLTFGVGLSCALPCFLYHREQILRRNVLPSS